MTHYPLLTAQQPPWKHQVAAYEFIYDKPGAMLFMAMGSGKSRVTIDLIQNQNIQKTLIVAPKRVITGHVWPQQIQTYGVVPFDVLEIGDGSVSDRARNLIERLKQSGPSRGQFVALVNYDSVWRDPIGSVVMHAGFDLVVLEESHRSKAPGGEASMFLNRLGKITRKRLALSGTPMAHTPYDAYAQFRFLDTRVFGSSFAMFKQRYQANDVTEEEHPHCKIHGTPMFHVIQPHFSFWSCRKKIDGEFCQYRPPGHIEYRNIDDLHKRFYSIAFKVGDEVLDLPDTQDIERTFELSASARKVYRDLDRKMYSELQNGQITPANAMVKLLRLQQLTGGWLTQDDGAHARVDTGKEELLADILEDIDKSEPIVVFCRFHDDLDAAKSAAESAGRLASELSGRRDELSDWEQGKTNTLVVQIQSGSEGINTMIRARYCIYYSVGTSLKDYEQSRKRIHRPGQQHTVTYIHLIAENTRDKATYQALQDHRDVIDAILENMREE